MSDQVGQTAQNLYNQEWKCKYIVGDWIGIYVGEGVEAIYIAKVLAKETPVKELYDLYERICDDHNLQIVTGNRMKQARRPSLWRRIKIKYFTPEFKYNYPADLDQDLDQGNDYLK